MVNLQGNIHLLKISWFEPSSTVKIKLNGYRYGNILKVLVGKHEGKFVDLLESGGNNNIQVDNACIHTEDNLLDSSFDLTDKKGILVAKMKIVLSGISRSGDSDNIEEFMSKVDSDVNRMSSLPSSLSTLGQILKSTKAIMDQFSKVVHLSS